MAMQFIASPKVFFTRFFGGVQVNYQTIEQYAEAEFVEKKSRFWGSLIPCRTEEEALKFIEEKKKEHWNANHNVYAYILRGATGVPVKRCSDDGEPQGTAGRPVLDVLEKEGLTDLCCVVTRYFGGTLLGTGGLVRAYSHTTTLAVGNSNIMHMALCKELLLVFDYSWYGKIGFFLPDFRAETLESDFGEQVTLRLLLRGDRVEGFCKMLTETTNGQVSAVEVAEKFADMA